MEQQSISREALYTLVWSTSLLSLSKQYNLSDNGFRKLCIRMEIPLPKNGHWQQVKFGKPTIQPPLPYPYKDEVEVILELRQTAKTNNLVSKSANKTTPVVPEYLSNPHPLIIRSKAALEKAKPDGYRYLHLVSCNFAALDIKVTKSNIGRALRFMDRLIKALEIAGHGLELNHGKTYVRLGTDTFQIFLREKTKRVIIEEESIGFTKYLPTGILAFSVGIGHFREFHDGRLTLEEQLHAILDNLETVNQEWLALRRSQGLSAEKEKEEQRLLQEVEDRRQKELADFNALLEKAQRWHKSDNLRCYIDEVERRAEALGIVSEEQQRWLEWARQKADWYDPFIERKDALLTESNRQFYY